MMSQFTYFLPQFRLQCAGKYTVKADYEKAGAQELTVKSGETVELIRQEDDGQW